MCNRQVMRWQALKMADKDADKAWLQQYGHMLPTITAEEESSTEPDAMLLLGMQERGP